MVDGARSALRFVQSDRVDDLFAAQRELNGLHLKGVLPDELICRILDQLA